MSNVLLLIVILIEGFVSIATEIITIRQLVAVVGNSVVVTSFIIGVFLLALAYGYKYGGRYVDNYTAILQRNFIIASGLLGLGLSYSFIILYFNYVETNITTHSIYILVSYLLLIVAPLIFLLGQTVPITMSLFGQELRAGIIGSKVLHISTIGSFLGAVLTTIVFMNLLGVAWTLIINCLLLLLAAVVINKNIKAQLLNIVSIAVIVPIIYWVNIELIKGDMVFSNAYSNYNVIDPFETRDGRVGKTLSINGSDSSFIENDNLSGFKYIEKIKKIVFDEMQLRNKDILVLGAGGFSITAAGTHENNFTYVDVDPDMHKVVAKNFSSKINGNFVASDARVFLRTNQKKYSLIISDTYGGKRSVPAHLLTKEYFGLLASNLDQSGVVIFNMIIRPTLDDPYSQKVDSTVRAVFNSCMVSPLKYSDKLSNVLYICKNNLSAQRAEVYADNLNRASLDVYSVHDRN
jgi:predicted membrane-bound spermidine synthase